MFSKNHPQMILRGKLDSLQAQVILTQCELGNPALVSALQGILEFLREMQRCEALDESFTPDTILGMSFEELRAASHALPMTPPDVSLGRNYALLNRLRTAVRETELAAVAAFGTERPDLTQALNRLSSAVHILMSRA